MRTYDNSVVIFYGRNINMGVEDNVGNMLLETVSNMPGFKVYRNIFFLNCNMKLNSIQIYNFINFFKKNIQRGSII